MALLQGENPSVQSALDIYHVLTESNTDLRQPVGLESQLLKESSMDSEVGRSMLQLLTVSSNIHLAVDHSAVLLCRLLCRHASAAAADSMCS